MTTQNASETPEELWQQMQATAEKEESWDVRVAEIIDLGERLLRAQPDHAAGKAMLVDWSVRRASYLALNKKYEEAISVCYRALELDPHCAKAYGQRASALEEAPNIAEAERPKLVMADYDRALAEWSAQIAQNPTSTDLYSERAHAYRMRGSSTRSLFREPDIAKEYYRLAAEDLSRAIELSPADIQLYTYRAELYGRGTWLEEYELAARDWDRIVELSPMDGEAYYNRGSFFDYGDNPLADADKALRDFTQAIKLMIQGGGDQSRLLDSVYWERALVFAKKQQWQEALDDCNRAIALGAIIAYSSRADYYLEMGKYDEALADYQTYARRVGGYAPSGPTVELGQNLIKILKRRMEPGYRSAPNDRVSKQDPLMQALRDLLAKAQDDERRSVEGDLRSVWSGLTHRQDDGYRIAFGNLMIELMPKQYELYKDCAYRYAKLGVYEMAVSYYTTAIELVANEAEAAQMYERRAGVHEKMRNYEKAVDDYTMAIRLDPSYSGSWLLSRASCYFSLKDWQRAKADYETLRRLKPGDEFYSNVLREIEKELRS